MAPSCIVAIMSTRLAVVQVDLFGSGVIILRTVNLSWVCWMYLHFFKACRMPSITNGNCWDLVYRYLPISQGRAS